MPSTQDTIDTPPLADDAGESPFTPLPLDASAAEETEHALAQPPLPPEPIALPTRHHATLLQRAVQEKAKDLEKLAKDVNLEYPAQARIIAGDAVTLRRDVLPLLEAQRELSFAGWPELHAAVSHSMRDIIEEAKAQRWPVERLLERLATRVARWGRRVAERAYHSGYQARQDTAEVMCIRECDQLTRWPDQSVEEKKRAESDEEEARKAREAQRALDGWQDDDEPAVDPIGEAAVDPVREGEDAGQGNPSSVREAFASEEASQLALEEQCRTLVSLLDAAGYVLDVPDVAAQAAADREAARAWAVNHAALLKAVAEGDANPEGVADDEYYRRVAAADASDAQCPTWIKDLGAASGAWTARKLQLEASPAKKPSAKKAAKKGAAAARGAR